MDTRAGFSNRDDLLVSLEEIAASEGLPQPSEEMVATVWRLLEDDALTLAVVAWDRGQSYARLRAAAKALCERLRGTAWRASAVGGLWEDELAALEREVEGGNA